MVVVWLRITFILKIIFAEITALQILAHTFMCDVLNVTGTKSGLAENWVEILLKFTP